MKVKSSVSYFLIEIEDEKILDFKVKKIRNLMHVSTFYAFYLEPNNCMLGKSDKTFKKKFDGTFIFPNLYVCICLAFYPKLLSWVSVFSLFSILKKEQEKGFYTPSKL